jgi:hypothetical protein
MKPIPGFPGYFADEAGNIYSTHPLHWGKERTPKKLKSYLWNRKFKFGKTRYRCIQLQRDGKSIHCYIYKLVLLTFVGPCPDGMEACHGPNGSLDDSLTNLCWGTREQNQGPDRRRDGTSNKNSVPPRPKRGEEQLFHKLTNANVEYIREHYSARGKNGPDCYQLAEMFTVSPSTINRIILRQTWKHI